MQTPLFLLEKHPLLQGFFRSWRGDERFYISSSRGIIPIKEMQSTHLRNAILKIHKEWLENLYKISDPIRFCREFITGCSDKTYIALVEELATRRA